MDSAGARDFVAELLAEFEGIKTSKAADKQRFDLGYMLVRARVAAGMTQAVISRLESGKVNPTYATVAAVVDALGHEITLSKK